MRLHDSKIYESLPEQTEHSTLLEIESKEEEECDFWQSQNCGLLLVTISAMGYGASASSVSLAGDLPTPLVIWCRFACVFICAGIWAVVGKIKLMEIENKKVLLLRSVFGTLGFSTGTFALQNLPVGEASVMSSASPVAVAIFSTCLLGDKLSVKTGVLITMCMIGVVMIVDPSALSSDSTVSQVTIVALFVAMCPPLFKGLVYIFIKQSQGSKMHYIKMSFWYSAFGMTVLTVFMGGSVTILCFAGQPYDWVIRSVDVTECIYLFAISFLGFIAQISMTKATQIINATVASLIRNGDIIFTILFQVLYFNDIPSAIQVGGIIFMVLSTVGVIIVKERARLEAAKNPGEAKPEEVGETMMARKRLF